MKSDFVARTNRPDQGLRGEYKDEEQTVHWQTSPLRAKSDRVLGSSNLQPPSLTVPVGCPEQSTECGCSRLIVAIVQDPSIDEAVAGLFGPNLGRR